MSEYPRSPVPALRQVVEGALTVGDLLTVPLWTVPADMPADEAARVLGVRDFDVAGVLTSDGDSATHYVSLDRLNDAEPAATVAAIADPILASDSIERSMPVGEVISLLAKRPFIFVMVRHRVGSIITRADLQSPVVTMTVLAYATALEMGLRELIPRVLGDAWIDALPSEDRNRVEQEYAKRRRSNLELGRIDCLTLTDLLHLAEHPTMFKQLGYSSRRRFQKETGSLPDLRNDVAHGRPIVASGGAVRASERVGRLRILTEVVWDHVDRHDPLWESYVAVVLRTPAGIEFDPPGPAPVYVITAWNPDRVVRSRPENTKADATLRKVLERGGIAFSKVLGASADDTSSKQSLAVTGCSRTRICEIGRLFGQRAVVELQDGELRVIRCADAVVVRDRRYRGDADTASNAASQR